jgi:hypothetical protein
MKVQITIFRENSDAVEKSDKLGHLFQYISIGKIWLKNAHCNRGDHFLEVANTILSSGWTMLETLIK